MQWLLAPGIESLAGGKSDQDHLMGKDKEAGYEPGLLCPIPVLKRQHSFLLLPPSCPDGVAACLIVRPVCKLS